MSNEIVTCPQHPGVPGHFVCVRCQTGVCGDCCYSMPDGSICCKSCFASATAQPVAVAAAPEPVPTPTVQAAEPVKARLSLRMAAHEPRVETPSIPAPVRPGAGCVQHPNVASFAKCRICGAGSCRTCNFVFNSINYCPVCASTSHSRLSPTRKGYMITAYVMAGWSTFCLFVLISGILASMVKDKSMEFLMGIFVILFMGIPAVIGTAMAMSSMRKGGNTISIWIAMGWNGLMLGGLMLMIVLGMFSD